MKKERSLPAQHSPQYPIKIHTGSIRYKHSHTANSNPLPFPIGIYSFLANFIYLKVYVYEAAFTFVLM